MLENSIYSLTTWIIPLLLCMIIHEVSHGIAALKLGDKTALYSGRLTLNPIPHIDIYGSILIPVFLLATGSPFLFGWAKPVPVSVSNLNRPKRDMGLVAAAGPLSNLILAILFVIVGRFGIALIPETNRLFPWFISNIYHGVTLSLVIGIFNLLPILPLDGGRILLSILPLKYAVRYQETEKYGFFILLGVLFILPMLGINITGWFVGTLYPFFLSIVKLFM
jgi:Zn-dependent protease